VLALFPLSLDYASYVATIDWYTNKNGLSSQLSWLELFMENNLIEHIDKNGLFIGNHHYPLTEAIERLANFDRVI